MPFLPALFAWVAPAAVWFLRLIVVSIVIKVVVSFGIAFAVFVGFDILIDELGDLVASEFGALPADLAGFVGLLRLDEAASMLVGALSFRATMIALHSLRLIRVAGA